MPFYLNLRYAARQLRKCPGFTITVLATLALCIGANTAVFSVVDTLFFRPPPYPEPEKLAVITTVQQFQGAIDVDTSQDGTQWKVVRDDASLMEAAVFGAAAGVNLVAQNRAEYIGNERVSANFFHVLGITPLLGREFTREEDVPNGPKLAIVSYSLWQRVFHSDPGILGKIIQLRGEPHTVIGVVPKGFWPPSDTIGSEPLIVDVWTPLHATTTGEGSGNNFEVIARLKPGVTFAQANAQLQSVFRPVFQQRMHPGLKYEERAMPFQAGSTFEIRRSVHLMWGAAALVLVIGCVNIAGLLLARSATRSREIATRFALGATRGAVVQELLCESLLIAVVGGALGIVLGHFALTGLLLLNPGAFDVFGPIVLNGRCTATMLLVSAATSLIFGLIPALDASKVDLRASLSDGARTVTRRRGLSMRRGLVFVEVMLGVVLVAAAGLLIRTFATLAGADPGFDPENVLIASASLQNARYKTSSMGDRLFRDSLARIRQIPGVESASVALTPPYGRPLNECASQVNGKQVSNCLVNFTYATPDMFETLRMKLLSGRFYTDADRAVTMPVAVANEAFVRRFLKNHEPVIDSTVRVEGTTWHIVGVVGNVQQKNGFGEGWGPIDAFPQLYVPVSQVPDGLFSAVHVWFSPVWMVRTQGYVPGLVRQMGAALAGVDPQIPFASFQGMQHVSGRALQSQRYHAVLFSTFAGLALLLAAVGVYGLVAQSVRQRTREMGIRLALGATSSQLVRTAAMPGFVLSLSGVGAGLILASAVTRVLKSLIWGVKPTDPSTFVGVGLLLFGVATVASFLPAARLTRIDPAQTLRDE
ncbi:MAG: ABC transporter permease [Acidobacteriaceae bacterium]|nr:ABC transporter permease [Acidobacteriaceae bacterium]